MSTSGPWLAEAAGGRLVRGADETFPGVIRVDTRLLAAGDAFVALPGAHVDGGRFCQEALDRGARAVAAFEDGVALIDAAGARLRVRPGLDQPHNLRNLGPAVAAALALGFEVPEAIELALPPLRWERHRIGPVDVVMDCAKTSALALSAALEWFVREPAVRRIAVLERMLA